MSNISTNNSQILHDIEKVFKNKKIKFYNIKKITDIDELNKKIFPIIVDNFENYLVSNYVAYHFDALNLKIKKYISHNQNSLQIELTYLDSSLVIKFIVDNDLTENDYAQAFQEIFSTFKFTDFVFYEWEANFNQWEKTKEIIQTYLSLNPIKVVINFSEEIFKHQYLSLFFIQTSQFMKKREIKIGYQYLNSKLYFNNIQLNDVITVSDFKNAVVSVLNKQQFIKLPTNYNYKNSYKLIKEKNWFKNSNLASFLNILQIRNHKFKINIENLELIDLTSNQLKELLNPWTRKFALKIKYSLNKNLTFFDLNFMLTVVINYQEIKEAFFDSLKNLSINATNFENINPENLINNEINKQIKNYLPKLKIDNVEYVINLGVSTMQNVEIIKFDNQQMLSCNYSNSWIDTKPFLVKIKIINFENWIIKKIIIFLQNFSQNNRFSLLGLSSENKWTSVIEKLKKAFNKDNDFTTIKWLIENENEQIYNSQTIVGGHIQKIIKIFNKSDAKNVKNVEVFFKDLQKSDMHKLSDAMKKLKQWTEKNSFDLKGFTLAATFSEVMDKVKNYYKDDEDFKNVEWFSKMNPEQKMEDYDFRTIYNKDVFYQILEIKGQTYKYKEIFIYYKNVLVTNHYIFRYAIKKISYFKNNNFDLKQISSETTWNAVLKIVKDFFKYDQDFKNISWKINNDSQQIYQNIVWKNNSWQNSQKVTISLEKENEQLLINFFNINKTYEHRIRDAGNKIRNFANENNSFDLSNLSVDSTWNDVLNELKNYFKNDRDFFKIDFLTDDANKRLQEASSITNGKTKKRIRIELFDASRPYVFAQTTNVYFKNIQDSFKKTFEYIVWKVTTLHAQNRLNLNSLSYCNTYGDALEKLKLFFKSDRKFTGVKWISIDNVNKELINKQVQHVIKLEFKHFKSENITVHYDYIKNKQKHLEWAGIHLSTDTNSFYFPEINKQTTYRQALLLLKNHLKNDIRFKNIILYSIGGESFTFSVFCLQNENVNKGYFEHQIGLKLEEMYGKPVIVKYLKAKC